MATQPESLVRCASCGDPFWLTERAARARERHGKPQRCNECRRAGGPTPRQITEMKRWWLERFTLEELRSWPALSL